MPDPLLFTETISPTDEAGVAEAVRRAAEEGKPVWPLGGGTSFECGLHAAKSGVGLSLAKLNRVVDHADQDLTVTAETGMTAAALAKTLAVKRQRLPVDVPQPERTTLGGLVAANPAGPRRYGLGTIRDYLIGFRAVDGQGTVFAGGGRVVKNAAGYDLCRLMVGSRGALAVLTQVTFMVRPEVEAETILAVGLPDDQTAEHLLAGLAQMQNPPVAIDLVAGPSWRNEPMVSWVDAGPSGRLLVGFEGTKPEVAGMSEAFAIACRRLGLPAPEMISSGKVDSLYRRLTELPVPSSDTERPLIVRIGVLPSAVVPTARRLRELDASCTVEAHAGDGILRVRFTRSAEETKKFVTEQLRPLAASVGGVATVLAAPAGAGLDRQTIWGPPGDGASVMRALKDRLDPKGVLSPGGMAFC
ncbi:MAG: FAD-binding oxidoreductase [Pirellulales bacterium]|nr:FAD-binding oxidoreductase [Pirellulales bacterium]